MAGEIITFSWHRKRRVAELPEKLGKAVGQVEIPESGNKINRSSEIDLYWEEA